MDNHEKFLVWAFVSVCLVILALLLVMAVVSVVKFFI